ncbi:uncharacterized protein UTRI_00814 [Ustilago trichophora]|uniref:Elongator complex protein 4 n=1 Tax=Ustilago trichophora TaxID=86804 RepID=A0A5C3DVC2_9BASI|nr:uncharacterized protein UTRI_00814 [Ustilago trichophora]
MSSFKRRVNPASGSSPAPLPAGVKPSSFSSPVPLISTGVPALDDLLSGGGLSSGSDLIVLPATGTAAQSAAQIGASSTTAAASAETDHAARAAAEPYVELLLGYSIAQGIASGHDGIVIGEDVSGLVSGLMARAGDLDEQLVAQLGPQAKTTQAQEEEIAGPSDHLDTVNDGDEADNADTKIPVEGAESAGGSDPQREREMKIAWRYHSMKQFNTTVNEPSSSSSASEPTPFCQTFDLSKRIDSRILQHTVDQGKLETVDISTAAASSSRGVNSYVVAYKHIEAAAERCRRQAEAGGGAAAPPVLRIAIRALGSPAWTVPRGQSKHAEVVRFLHRLKRLLRSLSLVDSATSPSAPRTVAIPSIAVISISSFLLSPHTSNLGSAAVNLTHRMVHSVDSAVSMSAFASSPALRSAFTAYTGAFKVLKTPAVGTLTNPSIRSSVLRGMGTGAGAGAAGGKSGGGEGGAGGGENNLAFKVRRKRLVIETLHLDVEGGVSERRTKPPKNMGEEEKKKNAPGTGLGVKSEPEQVAAPPSAPAKTVGSSFVRRQPAGSDATTAGPGAKPPAKFGGLSSLRQRGLAAAAAASASGAPAQREFTVEMDTATDKHPHSHSHGGARQTAPANRVANTRAEDLEF